MPLTTELAAARHAVRAWLTRRLLAMQRHSEQHLLLTRRDWAVLGADPVVSRSLKFSLLVCALLASYYYATAAVFDFPSLVNLTMFLIMASAFVFLFRRLVDHFHVGLAIMMMIMNFGYISSNTRLVIGHPQILDIGSIYFSIIFYMVNTVLFKRRTAFALNIGIYLTASFMAFRFLQYLPTRNLLALPATDIIVAWLFCTAILATQYLTIHVREHSLLQLAEARRTVHDLKAHRDLLAENARIRDELARMNRITVVEALTTTISHEMNQPIGSALTYAEASKRWLSREQPDRDEAMAAIDGVIEQIRRAGEIIAAIRRMTTRDAGHLRDTNLVELLDSLIPLIQSDIRDRNIILNFARPEAPERFNAVLRSQEIGQVIINLVHNSADAFAADQTRRHITIACASYEAGWIDIVVHDNASGIDAATVALIFDSFFTTKEGGTGLGLPICREIAERHGGSLLVQSRLGIGTQVTLRIPQSAA